MTRTNSCNVLLALCGLSLLVGCDEEDRHKQVAEVAIQAAERQAQQNTEMARLNREVAEGTRRMVEADAEARKEIIAVHQEIQSERASLSDGFETLEAERKQMAQERRTESILVPAARTIGVALVAVVVVGFCVFVLFGLRRADASDAELNELLIHDLVSEHPRLLNGPGAGPAIENGSVINESEPPLLSTAGMAPEEATQQGDDR